MGYFYLSRIFLVKECYQVTHTVLPQNKVCESSAPQKNPGDAPGLGWDDGVSSFPGPPERAADHLNWNSVT